MLVIGVIGDYGVKTVNSLAVSELVKSRNPVAIITTGDNIFSPPSIENYSTIVGSLYKEYISSEAQENKQDKINQLTIIKDKDHNEVECNIRFFPCVGNHDFPFASYTSFFRLPSYYGVEFVNQEYPSCLKLISINNYVDKDGRFEYKNSKQRLWLEEELNLSSEFKWIIVYFHYPQICSSNEAEGNNLMKLFPFHNYPNVALILSGHHHIYERLELNNITNVVLGTSGHSVRRKAKVPIQQSRVLDDSGFGALRLEIDLEQIKGFYYVLQNNNNNQNNVEAVLTDEFTIF